MKGKYNDRSEMEILDYDTFLLDLMSCRSSSTGPLCQLCSCRLNRDFQIIGCSEYCSFSVIKSPGKTGSLPRVSHSTATTLCLLCLLSDLNRILFGKVITDQLHLDAFKLFLLGSSCL